MISNIKKNSKIFGDSKVKIAVCGLPESVQNYYLKKIKNLKFEIVDNDKNFDYMIMNNIVFHIAINWGRES